MQIGITGGTGFLGRHLSLWLVGSGHEVVVFSRNPSRVDTPFPRGVTLKTWDALSDPMPPEHLDSLDAVVNLMGVSVAGLWTKGLKERVFRTRITGTRNLIEGWKRVTTPPRVLLSSSASGYYGDAGDTRLTEASPLGTGFLADLCRHWEAEAMTATDLGVRTVLLRTTLPLHPRGGILGVLLPAFRLGLGAVLGNGKQWFSWIHMTDWLSLITLCLENEDATGPVNLTAPNPVTNLEFTRTTASVLGRPVFLRVPAFALRVLAPQAADEMALVSQRVLPEKALGLGASFQFPELEGAMDDLLKPGGA